MVSNWRVVDLLVVFLALVATRFLVLRQRRQGLPPGPPGSFLLGDNRNQLPANEPWKKFAEWSKQYGPVISFYFGQTPIIVLNNVKVAFELLDRRGEFYSSRPRSITGQEILSGGMRGLPMEYGERWKRWRKALHIGIMGKAAQTYQHFQTLESSILMRDLLVKPDAFSILLVRFQISVVFSISYGSRVKAVDERIVRENERAGKAFLETQMPGRYIVDSWPILLWLPKSLQWFRYDLERTKALDTQLYTKCLMDVKSKMEDGTAVESMSSRMLASMSGEMDVVEQAYGMSAPFAAGVGTVTSALNVFLIAMIHHRECADKAHDELSSIVGHARMPSFEDAHSLPYVNALIKEVLRWRPVAPTGVPYATVRDDVYEGYLIPKGATVYANIGAMCLDPDLFPEPNLFKPERFLGPADARLADFTVPFGFGRRICPGMQVAEQSLFIVIARLLWAFHVLPFVDEAEHPVLPDTEAFKGGLVRSPLPFRVRLVLRNEDIRKLIIADAADAEVALRAWE